MDDIRLIQKDLCECVDGCKERLALINKWIAIWFETESQETIDNHLHIIRPMNINEMLWKELKSNCNWKYSNYADILIVNCNKIVNEYKKIATYMVNDNIISDVEYEDLCKYMSLHSCELKDYIRSMLSTPFREALRKMLYE